MSKNLSERASNLYRVGWRSKTDWWQKSSGVEKGEGAHGVQATIPVPLVAASGRWHTSGA